MSKDEKTLRTFLEGMDKEKQEQTLHSMMENATPESLVVLNSLLTEVQRKAAEPEWRKKLTVDPKGNIEKTVENLKLFLTEFEEYKDKLKYNEFLQQKEYNGRAWDDFDIEHAYALCEKELGYAQHQKVDTALSEIFSENRYNPVREYIAGLKWDGVDRMSTLFIDLLDADDTELTRDMTKKWFLAAVKRVFEPGCKFDNILVLQGNQGIGKSTICELLAKTYFNNISIDEIGTKDLVDKLNKTWIAIIDELDNFNKREMASIKTFLSTCQDSTRLAYARTTGMYKRHCVFIGSTNDDTFLRDNTSSVERRFWIVKCNKEKYDSRIKDTMTKEYVDQVWAEAYHKLFADFDQYLDIDRKLVSEFAKVMQEFKTYNTDVAIDYIRTILEKEYVLVNGEFDDDNDFLSQVTGTRIVTETPTAVKCKINKIPMSYILHVIKTIYKTERKGKYVANSLSADWDYKSIRYGNGNLVFWGLVRKNVEKQENTEKSSYQTTMEFFDALPEPSEKFIENDDNLPF